MRRTTITLLCVLTALAAPTGALAQEPEEPEPIPDFWTETEPKPSEAPEQDAPPPPARSTTQAPPADDTAPAAPECDPQGVAAKAAKAARRALRKRPLLGTKRRALTIRVTSCSGGDLELRLVDEKGTTTVARGRTTVAADATSKLSLRMTPAGRRYERRVARSADGRYELRVTARFVPAADAA